MPIGILPPICVFVIQVSQLLVKHAFVKVEYHSNIFVIVALIDLILNGDLEFVNVILVILFMELNAFLIKMVMIELQIVE